jgi:hypothetical protein
MRARGLPGPGAALLHCSTNRLHQSHGRPPNRCQAQERNTPLQLPNPRSACQCIITLAPPRRQRGAQGPNPLPLVAPRPLWSVPLARLQEGSVCGTPASTSAPAAAAARRACAAATGGGRAGPRAPPNRANQWQRPRARGWPSPLRARPARPCTGRLPFLSIAFSLCSRVDTRAPYLHPLLAAAPPLLRVRTCAAGPLPDSSGPPRSS